MHARRDLIAICILIFIEIEYLAVLGVRLLLKIRGFMVGGRATKEIIEQGVVSRGLSLVVRAWTSRVA